jgi:predicted esterase
LLKELKIDIIGGMSQGGAMSLFTALNFSDYKVKGVFALVSYNLDYEIRYPEIPAFLYIGDRDLVLPWQFS